MPRLVVEAGGSIPALGLGWLMNTEPAQELLADDIPQNANEAALLIQSLRGLPWDDWDGVDWEVLRELAERHGALLLVYRSLVEAGADVPGFFSAGALEHKGDAERLAAELECLLHSFAGQGIEVLPLKGPALAQAIYGDVALRRPDDLDLLVRRADYSRSEVVLMEEGFLPAGPLAEHHRRFFRGEVMVELHVELADLLYFPIRADDIWRGSCLYDFRGKPCRAMNGQDLILYLCCHGLKHRFSRIIWIVDLAKALGDLPSDQYQELMRRAECENLMPWLLIGCEVVRAMFPQQLPAAMDALIAKSPEAAQRARDAAYRLMSEEMQIGVNDYWRFYLQAEPNPWKRWRYRLRYIAPTYNDLEWAQRHRVHPYLMVILRPFRLLASHGLRGPWRTLRSPRT